LIGSAIDSFTRQINKELSKFKKLMPEVFYGEVFLKKKTNAKIQIGDLNFGSAAGMYYSGQDKVDMYFKDEMDHSTPFMGIVLVHELAHRYYYKKMSSTERQQWAYFYNELRNESATEYGGTSSVEDFAEAVAYYVLNRGYMKSKDVRDRLLAILDGKKLYGSKGVVLNGK